ncbi:hypothetical protein NE235_14905 [Actinoallomurus spadix]|uniref:Uncharacterized protein n=1 Tax=Actinoallomurus spadix TaxID=79912 RepID=A0ABP3G4I6_9ACTN|nr:hypothetical protein [Actinoallomurus spadix]MCO5987393.1 hypothetical protein [Actinoallomurus spadix]
MSAPARKDARSAAESMAADHDAISAEESGERADHRQYQHRHYDGDRMDTERNGTGTRQRARR